MMCGILGAMPPVDKGRFNAALKSLAHRGPDGHGVWCDDQIILGHRRLAILDISESASQPMSYLDRYHCVFNGEIYNYLEIRSQLERLGHSFRTNSDTEVLIGAYAQWGQDCLNHLNGMWSFAIWDSLSRRLFLSRDRLGKKPLFFFFDKNRFFFASEQKALLPFLGNVSPSKNFLRLSENSYSYEATEESLFESIKRFPAAHFGYIENGKLIKHCYWKVKTGKSFVFKGYAEQVEYLRELLIDSTKLRLRADVPIGTGLSGGIDSSLVASTISRIFLDRRLHGLSDGFQNAFVASFPNSGMDESHAAKEIALHLGIGLNVIDINLNDSSKYLESWAYLFEEIHEVNWIPHIALYKEMRRLGVKVSLDGHGGDELFCGYETSLLFGLAAAFPNVPKIQMVMRAYRDVHPDHESFTSIQNLPILKLFIRTLIERLHRSGWGFNINTQDALNNHLYGLTFNTVLPTLLRNYDRYSMINGVEVRMPLLDHRIVEFAFSIPWNSKIKNGYSKAILRDVAAKWVPKNVVINKRKLGFAPPIAHWIRGGLKTYLLDEVRSTSFLNSSLIDPPSLAKAFNEIILSDRPVLLYEAEKVWKQFNIYLWEKAFIRNKLWQIH